MNLEREMSTVYGRKIRTSRFHLGIYVEISGEMNSQFFKLITANVWDLKSMSQLLISSNKLIKTKENPLSLTVHNTTWTFQLPLMSL